MPRWSPVLLCALACLGGAACAETAPASAPAPLGDDKEPSAWQGRMTASLSATSGNSNSAAAQADVDISRKRGGGKTTLTALVSESQSGRGRDRESTAGRWTATAQHNRDIDAENFAFARLGAEHDRIIDLQWRVQAAVGLGRHLITEPERTLDVFVGLGRTTSRYRSEQTIGGETDSRFASNVILIGNEYTAQFTPSVSFTQRLEGYVSVDGDRNELFKFSTALNVDMTRRLALTVALTDTYNSKVGRDQKRNDLSLTTGLSVKIGP